MAGIFGGHLFQGQGLGQTTAREDAEFSSLISGLATPRTTTSTFATTDGKSGGSVTSPSGGKTSGGSAYVPSPFSSPATVSLPPPAATDNTMLYVVGGVAVVSVIAALLMSSRRRVTANRRGKRSRR